MNTECDQCGGFHFGSCPIDSTTVKQLKAKVKKLEAELAKVQKDSNKDFKSFDVSVTIERAYIVTVKALNGASAVDMVEDMSLEDIEQDKNFVDAFKEVDDEPDLTEE